MAALDFVTAVSSATSARTPARLEIVARLRPAPRARARSSRASAVIDAWRWMNPPRRAASRARPPPRPGPVEPAGADEARHDPGVGEAVGGPPRGAATSSAARACSSAVSTGVITAAVASTCRSPASRRSSVPRARAAAPVRRRRSTGPSARSSASSACEVQPDLARSAAVASASGARRGRSSRPRASARARRAPRPARARSRARSPGRRVPGLPQRGGGLGRARARAPRGPASRSTPARGRRGRLGKRPPQVARRRSPARPARGRSRAAARSASTHPRVAGGGCRRAGARRATAGGRAAARRAAARRARGRRASSTAGTPLGHRGADQRMAEPQRAVVVEPARRPRQRRRGRAARHRGPARRAPRRARELAAVAEHGHRRGQRAGAGAERRQPPRDAAPMRSTPAAATAVRASGSSSSASTSSTSSALPPVARRQAATNAGGRRRRAAARRARRSRARGERRRGERLGPRRAIASSTARSSPGSAGRAATTTATGSPRTRRAEVGQEAQARLVGPLQVVDDEQQRPLGRQVRHEPVQPVQRREPRVGRRRARSTAVAAGGGRAPVRRAPPRRSSCAARRAFEQLADDAEAELAFQLGCRDAHRTVMPPRARRPAWREQRGLADAGRPFDHARPRRGRPGAATSAASRAASDSRSRSASVAANAAAVGQPAAGEVGRCGARELLEVADQVRLVVVAAALRDRRPAAAGVRSAPTARWKRRIRANSFGGDADLLAEAARSGAGGCSRARRRAC